MLLAMLQHIYRKRGTRRTKIEEWMPGTGRVTKKPDDKPSQKNICARLTAAFGFSHKMGPEWQEQQLEN